MVKASADLLGWTTGKKNTGRRFNPEYKAEFDAASEAYKNVDFSNGDEYVRRRNRFLRARKKYDNESRDEV